MIFIIAVVSGGLSTFSVVSAESDASWAGRPVVNLAQYEVSSVPSGSDMCPASVLPLIIEGEVGFKESCVYGKGDGLRLARYFNRSGQVSYSVAFTNDSRFVPVRNLCTGMMRCVYSQSHDTLILERAISAWESGSAVIRNFSSHLVRHSDGGRYFTFNEPNDIEFIGANPSHRFSTGSIALSPNGTWGLVELRGRGVAKINLTSGEYRRVAMASSGIMPPGSLLEMAITNDGVRVALSGRGVGLFVYEITDTCGDQPDETVNSTITPGREQCRYTSINPTISSPRFQWVSVPRFSVNGDRLDVYGVTSNGVLSLSLSPSLVNAQTNPLYVAFGDSFTSGEGEFDDHYYGVTNTASNHCHNSSRSYPFLLGDIWSIETTSLACSGSRTGDVVNASTQLVQATPLLRPSVMSIGIGGNDIDLVGKLKSCMSPGTCEWATPEKRAATIFEIRSLLPRLVEVLSSLAKDFSAPPLIVVGYPTIINPDDGLVCGVPLAVMFDQRERRYMNEVIVYLNSVLKQAAAYARASFVDIGGAFEGERLCEGAELAMNGIRYGDDIAPIPQLQDMKLVGAESFHPTPFGHGRIVAAAANDLHAFWQNPHCNSCWFDESQLVPSAFWGVLPEPSLQDRKLSSSQFLATSSLSSHIAAPFSFPAGTFLPNSTVSLEIHSQVVDLGSFLVNDRGALAGEVIIPPGFGGYHTIHTLGETVSGEHIDLYETVYITEELQSSLGGVENISSKATSEDEKLVVTERSPLGMPADRHTLGQQGVLGVVGSGDQPAGVRKGTNQHFGVPVLAAIACSIGALAALLITTVFVRKTIKHRQSLTRPGD